MRGPLPLLVTAAVLLVVFIPSVVRGEELDDLENELKETQEEIIRKENEEERARQELERAREEERVQRGSLNYYQGQYQSAQSQLSATVAVISEKTAQIEQTIRAITQRQGELEHQQALLKQTVRTLYMQEQEDQLSIFLAAGDFSDVSKTVIYRGSVISEYKRQISNRKSQISKLQEDRQQLEELKVQLEQERQLLERQRIQLANSINVTQGKIQAAQGQQQQLQQSLVGISQSLAQLTQKEREILSAKAAAALASTTVGDTEVRREAIEQDPPQDGQTYFSFWTYGYPHRVGMNQYGAYGRAKAGQSAEQILKTYYTGVEIVDFSVPGKIKVQSGGGEREIDFENDYLMGIGEIPSCWGSAENGGMEALKAQAIAARTYALNYTDNGKSSICTNQNCQVYVGSSKIEGRCGEYWKEAVESTKGKVVTYGGQPISAWYASTAGGFTLSSAEVWGSARAYAQGIADLDDQFRAYDGPSHGDSPWYHRAWGDEPWLSKDQVADLFNAALLPETYNDFLPEVSKGGMSPEEVAQRLREEGIEPIVNLMSVEVFGATSAQVSKVRVYYDSGKSAEVSGRRFKYVFNLRSPSTNAIWTTRFDVVSSE